jgi:integrase
MPLKPFFRKFDGWWYVQLRTGNKRFAKKLVKGKESKQEAYRLFNQLMADNAPLPSPTRLHVHDLLAAFLRHSAEANEQATFEWYKYFLVNFDDLYGTLKPHQVTPAIVEAWLNANKSWKGSRRGAIIALKRAFNWAFDNDMIPKNYLRRVKKPPAKARERFLTAEERKTIFDNYPAGDPFRDFLFALDNTGCRPGEVSAVVASNVDLRTGVWQFDQHKTGNKTGERRVVVLTPEMVDVTKRLVKEHPEGPLFRNEDGNAWTSNSIRCRFRRVREKLGLGKDLVAYLYRHATATDMLEAGTGVAQVAEILGHKSVDMVMRHYSKIRQRRDHLRDQIVNARKRA